jgi:hypothetical protein
MQRSVLSMGTEALLFGKLPLLRNYRNAALSNCDVLKKKRA